MAKKIDARGLSCPQPVLLAVRAIEAADFPITVTVDNEAAKMNISRVVRSRKLAVTVTEDGQDFIVEITKP